MFVEEFKVTGSVNGKITSPTVIFEMTSELVWKWYNPETAQVAEMNTCGCQGNHTVIWPCGTSGEDGYIEQHDSPSDFSGLKCMVPNAVVSEIRYAHSGRGKHYKRMKQENNTSMLGRYLQNQSDSCPKCDEKFPFKHKRVNYDGGW